MVRKTIQGGIVAVTLGLAAATCHAATVTDATVDITGSYLFKKDKYRFTGDFDAELLGHPKKDRAYDVGITLSLRGKTVLDRTFSASKISADPFSIQDVLLGKVKGSGYAKLLPGFDLDGNVTSKSVVADGDFKRTLGKSRSRLLRTVCMSVFNRNAAQKCDGPRDFALSLVFSYAAPVPPLQQQPQDPQQQPQEPQQQPAPSPVPLPAGLPLLGAGLAAFAALRRTRR